MKWAFHFVFCCCYFEERTHTGFSRRPSHSPGLRGPLGGRCLCAHSPLRLFPSPDAFDLCTAFTFSPPETGIKTIFKIFSVLLAFKLFSLEESRRASNQPALWTRTASEDRFPFGSSSVSPGGPSWVLSPWFTCSSCISPCVTGPHNVCFPQHTVGFPDLLTWSPVMHTKLCPGSATALAFPSFPTLLPPSLSPSLSCSLSFSSTHIFMPHTICT